MRKSQWKTHDFVFHHVFAIAFDRENNALLTYVTLMPPHQVVSSYVEHEVANLVSAFRPARGTVWNLSMREFQELEFLVGTVGGTGPQEYWYAGGGRHSTRARVEQSHGKEPSRGQW